MATYLAARAGRRSEVEHDAVEDKVVRVAVFNDADKPTATKKAIEAPVQRPIGICVVGVGRVQELPCERINIRVGR